MLQTLFTFDIKESYTLRKILQFMLYFSSMHNISVENAATYPALKFDDTCSTLVIMTYLRLSNQT